MRYLSATWIPASVLVAALLGSASAQDKIAPTTRKHHPDVPSLPQLTKEEQFVITQVIYAAVMDDLGFPKGVPRNSGAIRLTFSKLGREAVPSLVEWMSYCNERALTCPCTILGTKLAYFMEKSSDKNDLDMLEFVHAKLTRGISTTKPLEQFRSLHAMTKNFRTSVERELGHKYKTMKLDDLLQCAAKFDQYPSTKLAEWRFMIATIKHRKDKMDCFDLLLQSMAKTGSPIERKAIHTALVDVTGVDHGPEDFDSLGPAVDAIAKWKEWREKTK